MVDDAELLCRDVGARLAALRRARGWTQEVLAHQLGMSAKHLQRIEAGLENLTLRTIASMARVLGVGAIEFFRTPIPVARRGGRPARGCAPAAITPVRVTPGTLMTTAVPLLTLVARGGNADMLGESGVADWIELSGRRTTPGLFAVRLVGASLAPAFPDGDLLLFRAGADGLDESSGALVLVEVADDVGRLAYVFKRIRVFESRDDSSVDAVLESLDPDEPPMRVDLGEGARARVVARFVEVVELPPRMDKL